MPNLSEKLSAFADKRDQQMLLQVLKPLYDQARCRMLTTAGLVITATTGKKVPKTGASACYGTVKGKLFSIDAGTDMPALSGTVTNAKFNVFCFFANKADASLTATDMTSAMGTEGTNLEDVVFPAFPEGKTLIGFVIINPTGTGNFVGDTTALDDGTVTPNTVYVSPLGNFDPSATY